MGRRNPDRLARTGLHPAAHPWGRIARTKPRRTAEEALKMVVAIDGPAGSGKSTVAKGVARVLGVRHLDTGAMYRALTWRAIQEKIDPSDAAALAALAHRSTFTFDHRGILVDGRPAEREVRTRRVSRLVSVVSAHAPVRREMVLRQREIVNEGDAVVEGRDIGTVVCPGADLKVFLTASPEERARRRHRELLRTGVVVTFRTLKRELMRRDALDASRPVSPLSPAEDAVVIDSTGRSAADVIAEVVGLARAGRAK